MTRKEKMQFIKKNAQFYQWVDMMEIIRCGYCDHSDCSSRSRDNKGCNGCLFAVDNIDMFTEWWMGESKTPAISAPELIDPKKIPKTIKELINE